MWLLQSLYSQQYVRNIRSSETSVRPKQPSVQNSRISEYSREAQELSKKWDPMVRKKKKTDGININTAVRTSETAVRPNHQRNPEDEEGTGPPTAFIR